MKKITIDKEFQGRLFWTSDLHLCHGNIINYCDRPFSGAADMNHTLVNNWNNVVTDDDIVFVLGDFCFNGKSEWRKWCNRLKGKKYLVLGNHDRDSDVYHEGFESVDDIVQLSFWDNEDEKWYTIILCHYCLTTWPGQWGGSLHCFAHSHTNPNKQTQFDYDYIANRALPSYDVGVDNNNYTPISWEELKIIFTKQKLYGRNWNNPSDGNNSREDNGDISQNL